MPLLNTTFYNDINKITIAIFANNFLPARENIRCIYSKVSSLNKQEEHLHKILEAF
jgi:hypothetical protein